MSTLRSAAFLLVAWIAAPGTLGCYRPRMVDCVLGCQSNVQCPDGMSCSEGLCTRGTTCVLMVAAGETHNCAAVEGQLKCWGGNASGQLGTGDLQNRGDHPGEMGRLLPAVPLGPAPVLVAPTPGRTTLALGSGHTCVVLEGGRLACWGDNRSGQLGLGDPRPQVSPADLASGSLGVRAGGVVLAVTAGVYHTCALLAGGSVKCWGDNRFGQLGLGTRGNRGGTGDTLGDTLPTVALGDASPVTSVVAGAYHTCALLESGSIKCWGWNQFGQLGVGDRQDRGLDAAGMGDALPAVAWGERGSAVALAAGAFHTCAVLKQAGGVACWGLNQAGQLGVGDTELRGVSAATSGERLPIVDLGTDGPDGPVLAITAGSDHTCVLLRELNVRCWGFNANGELGIGATDNRGDEAAERVDRLPNVALGGGRGLVTSLAAGAQHTCAVDAGVIKCWGRNLLGRLGVGDTSSRGDGHRAITAVHLAGDSE